jgi:hypothetical protein
VRQLAAALKKTHKIRVFHLFIESGSKLPHSESFAPKKYE